MMLDPRKIPTDVRLSKEIVDALIKEEEETAYRYTGLGKKYGLPELIHMGKDEMRHAEFFKRLKRSKRFN